MPHPHLTLKSLLKLFFIHMETRGVEPLLAACKAAVLPLSLSPRPIVIPDHQDYLSRLREAFIGRDIVSQDELLRQVGVQPLLKEVIALHDPLIDLLDDLMWTILRE